VLPEFGEWTLSKIGNVVKKVWAKPEALREAFAIARVDIIKTLDHKVGFLIYLW